MASDDIPKVIVKAALDALMKEYVTMKEGYMRNIVSATNLPDQDFFCGKRDTVEVMINALKATQKNLTVDK